MKNIFRRLTKSEDGATSIEYALIAVLLSVTVATMVNDLPVALSAIFNSVTAALN